MRLPPEHTRATKEKGDLPMVAYALSYARMGWPVFPLHNKRPFEFIAEGVKSHGFQDATTDEEQIQEYWTFHPTACIGLATGEKSGIIVLDIDMPEGYYSLKALQETYSSLPETRRVRTGNKGLHYYFEYPQDGHRYTNAVRINGLEGIDIRATGGYVVLPPSKLYGKLSYIWANPETPIAPLPNFLRDLLLMNQQKREISPQGVRFARSPGEYWLAQALERAREGNRNTVGFNLACQLRDDNIPEAEAGNILLSFASQVQQGQEPYTQQEALASVRSAYSRHPRERARRR